MKRRRPETGAASETSKPARRGTRVRRTAQGRASRERILEAAIEVITEHGFRASSVDTICRRAGIQKTAIYWHFGSKDGLLAALVERVAADWTDTIAIRAYAAGANPLHRLDQSFTAMREFLTTKPHLLRLLLTLTFEPIRVSAATRATLRRASAHAEQAIARGIEDTLGAPLPGLDFVPNLILAMLQAASVRMLIDPKGFDADRHFDDLRRLVVLAVGHSIREQLASVPHPAAVAASRDTAEPKRRAGAKRPGS